MYTFSVDYGHFLLQENTLEFVVLKNIIKLNELILHLTMQCVVEQLDRVSPLVTNPP